MKYKVNRNLILQKLDNKLVGFDVERSFLYTFNETAEYVFKKIKRGWEVNKIASLLAKRYEITGKDALKDSKTLLKELKKNKILV